MSTTRSGSPVHPVGIDLGTTYSCIGTLTPQGQPITLPNSQGEMATPSVVLFDGQDAIVGTEALRQSITCPERVVSQAKRFMGDPQKCWVIDGKVYRPRDISALILRSLLDAAEERLGRIRHAVITVPAQFSDLQRKDTVEAGLQAGLERVDIINEPVAAAMCYVLGEGMWFSELAKDQTVLVFDLGGGTFDLSLVKYNKDEVKVIASGGDLRLGGLDWNKALEQFACAEFVKQSTSDPQLNRETMQALAIEVEQAKRSLSVRPRTTLVVQHEGRRKTFTIDRDQFEILTRPLLDRTEQITQSMLKLHGLGWAHVDSLLVTGGATRMPMVRKMLQRISGTTLNNSLSPDQSICHGAAYYAGMLLSGNQLKKSSLKKEATARLGAFRQQSVSGRALGILVRDMDTGERRPHYLIAANTPLPCAYRQRFGTIVPNQRTVHLFIVESGTNPGDPHVEIGECVIDRLPENLPLASPIEVTIRYDEQGRIHVEALDVSSGKRANTSIVRTTESAPQPAPAQPSQPVPTVVKPQSTPAPQTFTMLPENRPVDVKPAVFPPPKPKPERITASGATPGVKPTRPTPVAPARPSPVAKRSSISLEDADKPVPLCNQCGEVLSAKGICPVCSIKGGTRRMRAPGTPGKPQSVSGNEPTEPMSGSPGLMPPGRAAPRRKPN